MKNIAIVVILGLTLFGCSSNWHLKQSKRHKLKAIQLGALIDRDTIWSEKEVITQQVIKDTVFTSKQGDTVFISKEKLKIKYVKIPGDSVFIEAACAPDTLKIIVPTTVTEVIHNDKVWAKWWIFLLVGFVVGIVLALWLRR
jgi:hypothetical protein